MLGGPVGPRTDRKCRAPYPPSAWHLLARRRTPSPRCSPAQPAVLHLLHSAHRSRLSPQLSRQTRRRAGAACSQPSENSLAVSRLVASRPRAGPRPSKPHGTYQPRFRQIPSKSLKSRMSRTTLECPALFSPLSGISAGLLSRLVRERTVIRFTSEGVNWFGSRGAGGGAGLKDGCDRPPANPGGGDSPDGVLPRPGQGLLPARQVLCRCRLVHGPASSPAPGRKKWQRVGRQGASSSVQSSGGRGCRPDFFPGPASCCDTGRKPAPTSCVAACHREKLARTHRPRKQWQKILKHDQPPRHLSL